MLQGSLVLVRSVRSRKPSRGTLNPLEGQQCHEAMSKPQHITAFRMHIPAMSIKLLQGDTYSRCLVSNFCYV